MDNVEVHRAPMAQRLVGSGVLLARKGVARALWLGRPRLPLRLTGPIVRRRIKRALADPTVMKAAHWHMEHLLGASGRADEIDEMCRRFVEHWTTVDELKWHPRAVARQRVEGAEHLAAAHALGKGVLLSFVHHAHYNGIFASAGRAAGVSVEVMAAMPKAPGPNLIQHFRVVGMGGGLLPATVGTAGLIDELKQGNVVAAAIDVPGGGRSTFAGRDVKCSSGPARAAFTAGSPVVLLTSHRDGGSSYIQLHEPLMPEDFGSVEELLEHLVRVHEGPVMAWAEAAYIPAVCWRPVED